MFLHVFVNVCSYDLFVFCLVWLCFDLCVLFFYVCGVVVYLCDFVGL